MRASNTDTWEELRQVKPDDVFEKRKRLAVTPEIAAGIGMKRGRTSGTLTRANFVTP
jgi:hypothetical protein